MMRRALFLGMACVLAALQATGAPEGAPAGLATAAQHAARAKLLYEEGFYQLLPEHARAQAQAKFALAERESLAAIRLDPTHEPAYRQLARIYAAQKRFADVIDVYRDILRMHPDDVDLRVQLADLLSQQERYAEALDELHTARGYTDDAHALSEIDRFTRLVQQAL